MQTDNRLLDDLARLATGAIGTLQGVKTEAETIVRQRLERILSDIDLVGREEFDAVKAMAANARAENEALKARIERLEAALKPARGGTRSRPKAKTTAAGDRKRPRKKAAKET